MATCKNITVSIIDFDPARVYYIYVRRENDPTFDMSSFNKTVSGGDGTVLITGLPTGYQYEIGISTLCGKATKSPIVWGPVGSASCTMPLSIAFDNGSATFTFILPDGNTDYEWRIDNKPWVMIASDTTTVRSLSFTDIQGSDGYESGYGTTVDMVFTIEVRMRCSSQNKSMAAKLTYIKDPVSEARVDLLENLCTNGVFAGQLIRLTMSVKSAAGGTESVVYDSPSAAAIDLASWVRTIGASPESEILLAKTALRGFNKMVVINPDPDLRSASIDFISIIPPEGMSQLSTIPCGAYSFYHSVV